MNKIRIGVSSLTFPVTMARYFIDALGRRDDVELFTVGPFSNTFIPWNGGINLHQRYVKVPYLPLPSNTPKIPYEMVKNQMPNDLDLFLTIDAGWHFTTRPNARITALIQTDPHVLKQHYTLPASYSDYNFCMQTPYLVPGEVFLPYGADTHWFYPEEREMKYDVCLIGLHYPQRDNLVRTLRSLGLNVYYDIGVVYDEYRELYNSSKVAISWSSLQDLPVRVWEAMAMARPLVTNRVPDLNTFFVEGNHYYGFDSVQEGVEKVQYALNNYDEASEVAQNAYRKIIAGHTFDDRVQQVLETCKLI